LQIQIKHLPVINRTRRSNKVPLHYYYYYYYYYSSYYFYYHYYSSSTSHSQPTK